MIIINFIIFLAFESDAKSGQCSSQGHKKAKAWPEPLGLHHCREVTCHYGHVNRFCYLLTYLLTYNNVC